MEKYIQITTTTKNRGNAEKIAETVVKKRLAACVQIVGPITSVYWWKEKIEKTEEWLCVIKTTEELYSRLEKAILEAHTYETPEILAVPVIEGSKNYLMWIDSELKR